MVLFAAYDPTTLVVVIMGVLGSSLLSAVVAGFVGLRNQKQQDAQFQQNFKQREPSIVAEAAESVAASMKDHLDRLERHISAQGKELTQVRVELEECRTDRSNLTADLKDMQGQLKILRDIQPGGRRKTDPPIEGGEDATHVP